MPHDVRALPGLRALVAVAGLATACVSSEGAGTSDAGADAGADGGVVADAGGQGLPVLGRGGAETLSGASAPGRVDGARGEARFNNPVNLALGRDDLLYVADFDNGAVRRVATDGTVETVVVRDNFQRPFGLLFLTSGRMLVETDISDRGGRATANGTIWDVDPTTGSAEVIVRDVGRPRGLLELPDGRVVMSDYVNHTIKILDVASGAVTLLAGAEGMPGYVDGTGPAARFCEPYDMVFADGRILIADKGNHVIRAIGLDGAVSTVAGTGAPGFVDGAAASARLDGPQALALARDGTVFFTDTGNFAVRALSPEGEISTLAGDGVAGHADAPDPRAARFFGLEGLVEDDSYLYVADGNRGDGGASHWIRRISLVPR